MVLESRSLPMCARQCPPDQSLNHPAHPGLHSAGQLHQVVNRVDCSLPAETRKIINEHAALAPTAKQHSAKPDRSYSDDQVARRVSGHSGEFSSQFLKRWTDILIDHPTWISKK